MSVSSAGRSPFVARSTRSENSAEGSFAALIRFALLASFDRDRLDRHRGDGTILAPCRHGADLLHDVKPVDDFTKHRVAVVEMRRRTERDEKLAAVGVGPRVGHRQYSGFAVP